MYLSLHLNTRSLFISLHALAVLPLALRVLYPGFSSRCLLKHMSFMLTALAQIFYLTILTAVLLRSQGVITIKMRIK